MENFCTGEVESEEILSLCVSVSFSVCVFLADQFDFFCLDHLAGYSMLNIVTPSNIYIYFYVYIS